MPRNRTIFIASIFTIMFGVVIVSWIFRKYVIDHTPPPKISLNILFSHHALATDLPLLLLQNKLRQSDIFLMEYPAWTKEFEEDLNNVSKGKLSTQDFFSKRQVSENEAKSMFQFLDLELDALYKSGVFVTSVDLYANDTLSNKINEYILTMNQTQLHPDFHEMLKLQRRKYEYWTDLQIERQQYMVDKFIKLADAIKNRKIMY